MNDSSLGHLFFSIIKREFGVFETQDDRYIYCSDVCAALLSVFSAETHHIWCFFVAFLKFPPIVQSGSILFRKLDREGAELRRKPPPSPVCDWLRCSCVANDITFLQRVTENSATF